MATRCLPPYADSLSICRMKQVSCRCLRIALISYSFTVRHLKAKPQYCLLSKHSVFYSFFAFSAIFARKLNGIIIKFIVNRLTLFFQRNSHLSKWVVNLAFLVLLETAKVFNLKLLSVGFGPISRYAFKRYDLLVRERIF